MWIPFLLDSQKNNLQLKNDSSKNFINAKKGKDLNNVWQNKLTSINIFVVSLMKKTLDVQEIKSWMEQAWGVFTENRSLFIDRNLNFDFVWFSNPII